MSELVVFDFDTLEGAGMFETALERLQKQKLITVDDAAIVTRGLDGKVKVHQTKSLTGGGALGGAFWGMLIGALFFMPWLGLAVGAVTGALAGKKTDFGVDDKFIKEVSTTIQPGHSALFSLVRDAVPDKVIDELRQYRPNIIRSSLSKEQEAKLREAFGAHEGASA